MTRFDDQPVAAVPDPIEADDPDVLRAEILRLRDRVLGADGRIEVLEDRVEELERRERELDDANRALHEELGRHPFNRVIHAVRRRLPDAVRARRT